MSNDNGRKYLPTFNGPEGPFSAHRVLFSEKNKLFYLEVQARNVDEAVFLACQSESMRGDLSGLQFFQAMKIVLDFPNNKPATLIPASRIYEGRIKKANRFSDQPSQAYLDYMANVAVLIATRNWEKSFRREIAINLGRMTTYTTTISGLPWTAARIRNAFLRAFGWEQPELIAACWAYREYLRVLAHSGISGRSL